jgi:hypothetical protein
LKQTVVLSKATKTKKKINFCCLNEKSIIFALPFRTEDDKKGLKNLGSFDGRREKKIDRSLIV